MTREPQTVTSADGTLIALDEIGDGPPVVLIGGAFNDLSTVAGLAKTLAPYVTAITYDRRGRGGSGDNSRDYDQARELDDLAAVLGHAGGSASVFGYSRARPWPWRPPSRAWPSTGWPSTSRRTWSIPAGPARRRCRRPHPGAGLPGPPGRGGDAVPDRAGRRAGGDGPGDAGQPAMCGTGSSAWPTRPLRRGHLRSRARLARRPAGHHRGAPPWSSTAATACPGWPRPPPRSLRPSPAPATSP